MSLWRVGSTSERPGPFGQGFDSEELEHWDRGCLPCVGPQPRRLAFRQVGCDETTRVSNASYTLAVVASAVLLTRNSQKRAHRSGMTVCFPLPSGELRTPTLRTLLTRRKGCTSVSRISRGLRFLSSTRCTLFLAVPKVLCFAPAS